jgi:hypothetical protein
MKMKFSIPLTAAAFVLLGSAPIFAQMTGTSHPEDLDDTQPVLTPDTSHYVPPSQAVPSPNVTTPAPAPQTPVLYQRYQQVPTPAPQQTAAADSSDPTLTVSNDVDSGVVIDVPPVGPNALPIGAHLTAMLQQPISTKTTLPGTRFTAALTSDVTRNGVVLLPAGSIVYGRITHVRSGLRIGGPSAIRLQPDSVSLPDGTVYTIHAEVTELDHYAASHVNNEGAIVGTTNTAVAAGGIGLTATSAVVAGAMIGGGVGAVVGLGVGAGVATVWWLKHDRQQELPAGTEIVFTLNTPLQLNPTAH